MYMAKDPYREGYEFEVNQLILVQQRLLVISIYTVCPLFVADWKIHFHEICLVGQDILNFGRAYSTHFYYIRDLPDTWRVISLTPALE